MDYSFLSQTLLFQGLSENEIEQMLRCINAREKAYQKNEIIFKAGNRTDEIGLVEAGGVNIVVNFYTGNSNILGHSGVGNTFAENYAVITGKELICDVVATDNTEILFLNFNRLMDACKNGFGNYNRIIYNLLSISAQKSLNLTSRMTHTAPKSIRERLLSYLSEQSIVNNSMSFTIPFNRQQLADYLGVDRSAMSNELGKMRKDGIILCRKNKFTLIE